MLMTLILVLGAIISAFCTAYFIVYEGWRIAWAWIILGSVSTALYVGLAVATVVSS